MDLLLTPARLIGKITPPASKSQAHRMLIAAALADKNSNPVITHPSQDILATRRCLAALCQDSPSLPLLDCGESGSTLRFLFPLALVLRGGAVFTGRGRLMERPMGPYKELCRWQGIDYTLERGYLTVRGSLKPDLFPMEGNLSSQFISGLLFALPLLGGNSEILLPTPLESAGYVEMTLQVLRRFGVQAFYDGDRRFQIPGRQAYQAAPISVEADYSQAAFFFTADAIGNDVTILNLTRDSMQGDRVITALTEQLSGPGEVILDVSQCPDLVPALALHGALREGCTTRLENAGRLRIKESDRLATVAEELGKLGADIAQTEDSLVIRGVSGFHGGVVHAHNDHRIAMMLAIAATRADAPVLLQDAGSVNKSYPGFWRDYVSLGGNCREYVVSERWEVML
jgi:3-phosphoshikimate 1-carboxyvinyltransferase